MNNYRIALSLVVLGAFPWVTATPAVAQFDLAGSLISSGGNASSGGGLSLHGSLGQVAVGGSSGNFGLCSGFWCTGGINPVSVDPPPVLPGKLDFRIESGNPTAGQVVMGFSIPEASEVKVEIFDVQGRRIALPVAGRLGPGEYRAHWDAGGRSGVYFVQLLVDGVSRFRERIVLVR